MPYPPFLFLHELVVYNILHCFYRSVHLFRLEFTLELKKLAINAVYTRFQNVNKNLVDTRVKKRVDINPLYTGSNKINIGSV